VIIMWQPIAFGFLGGVAAANGYPHFTRGITKRRYPCNLGNGPVPNFLAGWAALVGAGVLFYFAHVAQHPGWALGLAAAGVLLMGLFHAGPGAFGRPEPSPEPEPEPEPRQASAR
jgi:hypothetical protein